MLGETLLDIGAISREQLDRALAEQARSGALLGEVLLAGRLVTEGALARALAHEARVPFVSADEVPSDPAAAGLVPESFARQYRLVPVSVEGRALRVLQANPLDVLALDDLGRMIARPVVASCATLGDILRVLDRSYGRPEPPAVHTAEAHPASAEGRTNRLQERLLSPLQTRDVSSLGLSARDRAAVEGAVSGSRGLVVLAGPSGSGRRTTAAALLALRPAALFVGPIDDTAAAQRALDASITRVAIGTLSASTAAQAISRLIALDVGADQLATSLTAVVAQRLVRLVCAACRAPHDYSAATLAQVKLRPDPGLLLYRGRGCPACQDTGYEGKTGVFEVLVVGDDLRALVRTRVDEQRITPAVAAARIRALTDDALTKALLRQTTLEEVLEVGDA